MIIGLLIFFIIQHASSQKFRKEISSEEMAELFPSATKSQWPEYEIVPIYHSRIQKRDNKGRNFNFQVFNRRINLWLNPIDGTLATSETPVYLIESGFKFTPLEHIMKNITETLYEDKKKESTISLKEMPDGNIELNGIIEKANISVRSLPKNFIYSKEQRQNSLNDMPSNAKNFTYHIIQKLSDQSEYLKSLKVPSRNSSKSEENVIETIYPEILVVVDYSLFKIMNENYYKAVEYILAFFNGVDLKFKSIDNPRVRLNIAGIIIASKPNALEYMYHLSNKPYDLIVNKSIKEKQFWIAELETKIPNYINFDVAITLSSDIFCELENKICERKSIGLATLGGACLKETWKGRLTREINAIVHDKWSFEGIGPTAHELGHLLGIEHDGERNSFRCNANEGHIMAPMVSLTINGSKWSCCSIEDLKRFLTKKQSECLLNIPEDGQKVPRILPGKLKNADEQCKRIFGTKAAYINDNICLKLQCIDPNNSDRVIGPLVAADGTPCGYEKICFHQRCVKESIIKNKPTIVQKKLTLF